MTASAPKNLRLPKADAETLLYAEALEAHPPEGWSAADGADASRDARAVAGDAATTEAFLLTRAKLVLARMRQGHPGLRPPKVPEGGAVTKAFAALLAAFGFFSGAVTDQLTSAGAELNLLSPPLLAVLLWNVAAVLLALAGMAAALRTSGSPSGLPLALARGFTSLSGLSRLSPIGSAADKAFLGSLLPALLPQAAWRFRAALHWAALAFGVGVAASLLVRGIGTAYWAVWESTWFAGRPDAVATVIGILYGWIPSFLPGLSPLPDATALEALRSAGSASPAALAAGAPWLARMIWAIILLIVLPRLALALLSGLLARRTSRSLTVALSAERLDALMREAAPKPARKIDVNATGRDAAGLGIRIDPWNAPDFPEVEALGLRPQDFVTLHFDPAATPEEEVHGALVAALRKAGGKPEIVLDFAELQTRFADAPERIRSRRALWEHFAAQRGAALKILGLD